MEINQQMIMKIGLVSNVKIRPLMDGNQFNSCPNVEIIAG